MAFSYKAQVVNGSSSPTIQFEDNSGVLSLPLNGIRKNYKFTLSNIEGEKVQSSFQCLQHVHDSNSSLESLGFMLMKMQIHATEDSYEKTKSKMTAAEQEQKNLCTKELRQSVARLSNKVTKKRPGLVYVPEKSPSSIAKPEPAKLNLKNKVTSSATLIQQPIRQRIIQILAAKTYKKAELILRLKREGISDKDKELINAILTEVAKTKGNILSLENHVWNEVQEDWEFNSKEELQLIKKKKLQILKSTSVNGVAEPLKTFVKQEENKNNQINDKLTQYMNRQVCKSIQNPNLLDKKASRSPKKQSVFNNNMSSLLSSFVRQEHGYEVRNGEIKEEMCIEMTSNNNGIAHCELRPSDTMITDAVPPSEEIEHNNISKKQINQSKKCPENISASRILLLEKINLFHQKLKSNSPVTSPNKAILNGNTVNDSSSKAVPIAQPLPEFDFSEICKKYTKVESLEQRSEYVKDYNNDHEEYIRLQAEMKEISDRFSTLYNDLSTCKEGSPEYKRIKLEIGKEYKRASSNSYFAARKRFEFLKAKLSCIKNLILEYDKNL